MKRLTAILLVLLCVSSVQARRVRLYGYVLDEQNRGIEACNVFWKESVATTAVGSSTNKNGYYDLTLTSEDSVTIVYSMLGYETVEMRLLPTRDVLNINIELRESGDHFVVMLAAPETPSSSCSLYVKCLVRSFL